MAEVLAASAGGQLSGPWRLMLLGDGSPTRHLQLLTGLPLEVELIAMAPDPDGDPLCPREVRELEQPLLRRQVWLACGDLTLGWAESWWNRREAEAQLRRREQPIWRSLTEGRTELFREVDGLPPLPLLPPGAGADRDPRGVLTAAGDLAGPGRGQWP
jgi:chorismate--pyruvate lyase